MHAIEPVQKSDDSSKSRTSSDLTNNKPKEKFSSSSKEESPNLNDDKQNINSGKENTGTNESNQENQTKISFFKK